MFIATLIAAEGLCKGDVSTAADRLRQGGLLPAAPVWIEVRQACDLPFDGEAALARVLLEGALAGVDVVIQPSSERAKRLLMADMDSTMITVECIDELADFAGVKAEVAEVTERAMRGELDFAAALDARVALLEGLGADAIDRCRHERVRLMPGAQTLVRTMAARGARCVLVSGGFTAFAAPIAAGIGFHHAVANRLVVENGRITGRVERPIVDNAAKIGLLVAERRAAALSRDQVLAVGDGANDVPMLRGAGLGVAFRAKPVAEAGAGAAIRHGDLRALLLAQGLPRRHWIDAG